MNPSTPFPIPLGGFSADTETPRRPRKSALAEYRSGSLREARTVVVEDLGDIPLVSVDFFLKSVLPPVDEDILKQIKATLIQQTHIKRNLWKYFPKAPKGRGMKEVASFKGLQTIFTAIAEAASPLLDRETVLAFQYKPDETPLSERNNTSRPDGHLELKVKRSLGEEASRSRTRSQDPKSNWEDIVLPCEFKLDLKDWQDNISKLIWSAHHVMRTDPCRRFTFGITAENDMMRLWFFSRSHVMTTQAFNFVTDLDTAIQLFTSLACADLEDLGFDLTVSRVMIGNQLRYRFQVGDEFYITSGTLSDHAADFIRGRGTRVFKAYLESDPRIVVALKDVWLEDDRTEEGVLLETIRSTITTMQSNGVVFPGDKNPSEYFLTVKAHGRVKIGDRDDHTSAVMMRGFQLPSLEYLSISTLVEPPIRGSGVKGSDRPYSVGHTPTVSRDAAALVHAHRAHHAKRFQARIRYRIVFNEIGKTIHELDRLVNVYQCLGDVAVALKIMHMAGYVHRDVSAGNILFWNGAGILSDLEFAKKTSDLTMHEVRIGTNQYEAIEVTAKEYMFRDDEDASMPPAFKFNCIHDLESTWWIALWVLFHHVPAGTEESRDNQLWKASLLFPAFGTSINRNNAFLLISGLREALRHLAPAFQKNISTIINVRNLLVKGYKTSEQGASIKETAFADIHEDILRIWRQARDEAEDITYTWILSNKRAVAAESPTTETEASSSKRCRTS